MENEHEIQIYVACLASYNNGILHGRWINAAQDAWAIYEDIRAMLSASTIPDAEEWAIHDYEGFGEIRIDEHFGIEDIVQIAAFIAEHGALGAKLVYHLGYLPEAREVMADGYHGAFGSLADYVQEITEECTDIPEALRPYIDWQAMARDAEMGGDLFTIQTAHDEVHVFSGV